MSNSLPKSSNLELYNVDRYPSGKSEIPVSGHDNTTTIHKIVFSTDKTEKTY